MPSHPGIEYNTLRLTAKPDDGFAVGSVGGPAYENQRWLLLMADENNTASAQLEKTPIMHTEYNTPFGPAVSDWKLAAQQHYSLFKNLEDNQLSRYHFGMGRGVWDLLYQRYNLIFIAIRGEDVAARPPVDNDELEMTVSIPRSLRRPHVIASHALVAHFSFIGHHELKHTDLLHRYRAYANERVCASDNQKLPRTIRFHN